MSCSSLSCYCNRSLSAVKRKITETQAPSLTAVNFPLFSPPVKRVAAPQNELTSSKATSHKHDGWGSMIQENQPQIGGKATQQLITSRFILIL